MSQTVIIKRTLTPDLPPPTLQPGELAVEMASIPPKLWVGVPTNIDPVGKKLLSPTNVTIAPEISFFQSSGTLKFVSRTQLSFKPYNGNQLQIDGKNFVIPDAGIPGLSNVGLVGATRYYVYVYNNAGVLTAEFSTVGHSTSTKQGNSGTEIKIGDDSRTLIGMVYTGSNTQFYDEPAYRFVRSWFNDTGLACLAMWPSNQLWASVGWNLSGYPLAFLSWANEWVSFEFNSPISPQAINVAFQGVLTLDGINVSVQSIVSMASIGYNYPFSVVHDMLVTEGYHVMNMNGNSGGNAVNFFHAVLILRNTGSGV